MTERVDVVIIGAGVIGLAVAAEIGSGNRDVFVLERNPTFGEEASSRNSEVIHAGIYYPYGSLKARLCVEGARMIYEISEREGVFCKKTGKLIVAKDEQEEETLEELFKIGEGNGVRGLKLLSRREVKKIEPDIKVHSALYSPNTGIVDSHELMRYFLSSAKSKGVEVLYRTKVIALHQGSSGYDVVVEDSDGERFSFATRFVINCAGLASDTIAQMVGIDVAGCNYILKYCKGSYFQLRYKTSSIDHLVYPVPRKESLGIHVVLDRTGRIRLGPDAEYIERTESPDYSVDVTKRHAFYSSVKEFLPFVKEEDLAPDMAGIRSKLQGPGEDFRDFVIEHEERRGYPGFVNLIGIDSPGLTASPAIAKYVGRLLEI